MWVWPAALPTQLAASTFRICPCWRRGTSGVGSLEMPSGGSCPLAGACTWGYGASSAAGPRRRPDACLCWWGSLPGPWEPGGCWGGAPNTWMETGKGTGEESWRKVCTSKGNLDLMGINWDRPGQRNIRRQLMICGSRWMSCSSPALPQRQHCRFAFCLKQRRQTIWIWVLLLEKMALVTVQSYITGYIMWIIAIKSYTVLCNWREEKTVELQYVGWGTWIS